MGNRSPSERHVRWFLPVITVEAISYKNRSGIGAPHGNDRRRRRRRRHTVMVAVRRASTSARSVSSANPIWITIVDEIWWTIAVDERVITSIGSRWVSIARTCRLCLGDKWRRVVVCVCLVARPSFLAAIRVYLRERAVLHDKVARVFEKRHSVRYRGYWVLREVGGYFRSIGGASLTVFSGVYIGKASIHVRIVLHSLQCGESSVAGTCTAKQ